MLFLSFRVYNCSEIFRRSLATAGLCVADPRRRLCLPDKPASQILQSLLSLTKCNTNYVNKNAAKFQVLLYSEAQQRVSLLTHLCDSGTL